MNEKICFCNDCRNKLGNYVQIALSIITNDDKCIECGSRENLVFVTKNHYLTLLNIKRKQRNSYIFEFFIGSSGPLLLLFCIIMALI